MAQWPISAFRVAPPLVASSHPVPPPPRRGPGEERTLVVGRGITLQGSVQDVERLVVEGTVEGNMVHANQLTISPGGIFTGGIEVEDAEIAGAIDGRLTVWNSLIIRDTGRVLGIARCRRLQVQEGGQINGQMEMITELNRPEALPRPPGEPV